MRGSTPGPLFIFVDSRLLNWQCFVDKVCEGLQKMGIDQSQYCGHSFSIGAATMAAAKGMEDYVIKTLGQWESLTYLQYVKVPCKRISLIGAMCLSMSLSVFKEK